MFYVYIIKSTTKNWYYVGISKNLERRLISHNSGLNRSTKPYKPFRLKFAQMVSNGKSARNLEKFLKVRFNKEALLDLLED